MTPIHSAGAGSFDELVSRWAGGDDLDALVEDRVAEMSGPVKLRMIEGDVDFWDGRLLSRVSLEAGETRAVRISLDVGLPRWRESESWRWEPDPEPANPPRRRAQHGFGALRDGDGVELHDGGRLAFYRRSSPTAPRQSRSTASATSRPYGPSAAT